MPRFIPVCAVIATLCCAIAPAQANEPWQIQIAPHVLAVALEGVVAPLPGVPTVSVDASFGDLVENLDVAFIITGGVVRLTRIGPRTVNIPARTYYNLEHPDFGTDWSLRLQI